MKILQVNQITGRGGAAGLCMALHKALLAGGHESAVLVGRQSREIPGVGLLEHDRYRSNWGLFWMAQARWLIRYSGRVRGAQRVSERWLPRVAAPRRFLSWWSGQEDFDFPGTRHLLEQTPFSPDVLHLHNLHGDFFDLRELPRLSRAVPTVISLHDAWLLSGHCAHSFDCERWKTGCGDCPRLDIPPAVRRDGTAFNWLRKQAIYQDSRLSLVCPSQWLADKVRQSILMPGTERLQVIPNGVDTSVFKPGDKAAARKMLGWPQDAFIVMFAASGVRKNMWKDYPTMREAIRLAGERVDDRPIRFFAVGETAPPEQAGAATIEFLPYRESLAACYQAADVYLHAARAEVWGMVITEALACGTPVVATAVGGIPEQIIEGGTGFLVPVGDALALAQRLTFLEQAPDLVRTMGAAASQDAADRFSLKRMVANYVQFYQEVIDQRTGAHEH
jgi:glycosyltransferase involved in cell wall biosynthesis